MDIQRLSVEQIMLRIAHELRYDNRNSWLKSSGNLWQDFDFDLRLAVTNDLYETDFDFRERYGVGHPFHFSLSSYQEGKELAKQLYYQKHHVVPDMSSYTGEQFKSSDFLILFLYIQNIAPKPRRGDEQKMSYLQIFNCSASSGGQ